MNMCIHNVKSMLAAVLGWWIKCVYEICYKLFIEAEWYFTK